MDPALLVLGVTSLAPFGALWSAYARATRAERERALVWSRVARELGLAHGNDAIFGRLEGHPVQLALQRRQLGKTTVPYTVVGTRFAPALDLGLSVQRASLWDDLAHALGGRDVAVGEPRFDAAFQIAADEPARAAALLVPELRAALLSAHAVGLELTLTDEGFHVFAQGSVRDPRWLGWALRYVAGIARVAAEARARVPVATPLAQHRSVWRRYAQAAGLSELDTPLSVGGTIAGQHVYVYAARTAPLEYRLEVEVRFEEPLGLGLLVRPEGRLESLGSLFHRDDHALGDDRFDDTFVVRCRAPERLSTVLDPEVRAALLALAERGAGVVLRDEGLVVRAGTIGRPEHAPRLVEELRGLAERIWQRARRGSGAMGPYR